jgi:SAM-dependent methyltransferase
VNRATSFGARAAEYERGRPSYPEAALRWCLADGARQVLDLGAGTGKLTRVLLGLGLEVTAVEPLPEMRAYIPGALGGSAEEIPLPDASVDAVFAGQAFHWFDPDRAMPEIVRVLRPGGTVGLVWNRLDDRVPWVAEIVALIEEPGDADERNRPFAAVAGLTEPVCRDFPHAHDADADLVVDRVASSSCVIVMSEAERAAALARARAAVPAGRFRLPYVCHAWRATCVG